MDIVCGKNWGLAQRFWLARSSSESLRDARRCVMLGAKQITDCYRYLKTVTIKGSQWAARKEKSGKRSKLWLKKLNTRDGLRSSTRLPRRMTKTTRCRLLWFRNYCKRIYKSPGMCESVRETYTLSLVNPAKQKIRRTNRNYPTSLYLKRINSSAKVRKIERGRFALMGNKVRCYGSVTPRTAGSSRIERGRESARRSPPGPKRKPESRALGSLGELRLSFSPVYGLRNDSHDAIGLTKTASAETTFPERCHPWLIVRREA